MNNVLEVKEQFIHTTIIYNPLEPITSRRVFNLSWSHEKTLYDYIYDLPEDIEWDVVFNLNPITIEESKEVKPMPGSFLVISPRIAGGGGGGGKNTMRMVAMVAVMAAAIFFAPAALSVVGGLFGAGAAAGTATVGAAGWAALSTSGVLMASGMAVGLMTVGMNGVNKLIPPSNIDNKNTDFADTYGNDSTRPVHIEGSNIGLCYGEYRVGGVFIQNRTANSGNNQTMYILQALSEGEVESISDVFVNKQPVAQYNNVETQTRMGTNNQELVPWFEDSYTTQYKGVDLSTNWVSMRTQGPIDKFSMDLTFPLGLYYTHTKESSGKTWTYGMTVDVQVQYKKTTESEWKNLTSDLKGFITDIQALVDGNEFSFYDKDVKITRHYVFRNIVYTDFLEVKDESGKVTDLYFYVKTEDTTSATLDNFVKVFEKNIDGSPAPDVKITKENYSSSFKLTFSINSYNYDFHNWDISVVGENSGKPVSFSGQNINNFSFYDMTQSAVRRVLESPQLFNAQYDIRVRRTSEEGNPSGAATVLDKCTWVSLNEINLDDITYNNTALLATKIKMDGQLNGTPEINALVKGIKVHKYNYDGVASAKEWSANPAWIAIDLLTNKRYGGGINVSRLDIPKFIEWAEYCEEKNLRFDGYLNSDSNIWDMLQLIVVTNHAQLIICGTKISVSIDKVSEPIFLFNNSNIIKDSFQTSWAGIEDRANCFEITYNDKDKDYESITLKILDSELANHQGEIKTISSTAIGVTTEERAFRELKRYSLRNKYLKQTASFSAPIEAVGCTIGDVVIVQHDIPQWGFGGKLERGCTKNLLKLDRPVNMLFNRNYAILIHHDAVMRYSTPAVSVIGKSIFINQPIQERVLRLKVNGRDLYISKIIKGAPYTEIILDEANVCQSGDIVELWDTDVLEEALVVTDTTNDTTDIQLIKPLEHNPQYLSSWLFGYKEAFQKKFRIESLSGLNTDTIQLDVSEYSDNFYNLEDYEGEEPDYSMLETKPQPVTELKAEELLVKSGSSFSTNLYVDWNTKKSPSYFGADIYTRNSSDSLFSKVGETKSGFNSFILEGLEDNQYLEIKIVAFDALGRRCGFNESPIISHTVLGKSKKPNAPLNFQAKKTSQGILLSWNPVIEADVYGYIIKEGNDWLSGNLIDENVTNNRCTIQYTEAGTKNFMLKTVDVFGNISDNFSTASIVLTAPLDPIDFLSVQNNDFVVLKWNNLDSTVAKFRIKEGESWGSGTIVADVSGYSHSVPVNGYYNRKFWIKSVDNFGVFCINPKFTQPDVLEHQSKNIIVKYEESKNQFPNPKINMNLYGDYLIVNEGIKYGEYNWPVDIGETLYSRVISRDEIDAIEFSPKLQDAHFKMNSYEAQSPLVKLASLDNVIIERQMALPDVISPSVIESFSFYNATEGERGTKPYTSADYKYEAGRFRNGIVIDDSYDLGYNINIPETFSLKFWVRPQKLISAGYITLSDGLNKFLKLSYRESSNAYILKDEKENENTVQATFVVDEPILVNISQTPTTRTLMIGFSKNLEILSDTKGYTPVGSFNTMKLN